MTQPIALAVADPDVSHRPGRRPGVVDVDEHPPVDRLGRRTIGPVVAGVSSWSRRPRLVIGPATTFGRGEFGTGGPSIESFSLAAMSARQPFDTHGRLPGQQGRRGPGPASSATGSGSVGAWVIQTYFRM